MANITIKNLEVESTALNQVSPGEMEKVVGGQTFFNGVLFWDNIARYTRVNLGFVLGDLMKDLIAKI